MKWYFKIVCLISGVVFFSRWS